MTAQPDMDYLMPRKAVLLDEDLTEVSADLSILPLLPLSLSTVGGRASLTHSIGADLD